MEQNQFPDTENGSIHDPPITVQNVGGFEITMKVAELTPRPQHNTSATNSNGHDPSTATTNYQQQNPLKPVKSTVAKGVQRGFSVASNLGNFLPTGTNLIFETLLPTISRNCQCSTFSTVMICVVLGLGVLFCLVSSFTDSVELSNGKLLYGFVTSKGLRVYDKEFIIIEDEKYELEFADVLHAVMSVVVFLAIAFTDQRVTGCLFPRYVKDMEHVMESLVLIVAFICSSLFLLFPVYRRGFVPSMPGNKLSIARQ